MKKIFVTCPLCASYVSIDDLDKLNKAEANLRIHEIVCDSDRPLERIKRPPQMHDIRKLLTAAKRVLGYLTGLMDPTGGKNG